MALPARSLQAATLGGTGQEGPAPPPGGKRAPSAGGSQGDFFLTDRSLHSQPESPKPNQGERASRPAPLPSGREVLHPREEQGQQPPAGHQEATGNEPWHREHRLSKGGAPFSRPVGEPGSDPRVLELRGGCLYSPTCTLSPTPDLSCAGAPGQWRLQARACRERRSPQEASATPAPTGTAPREHRAAVLSLTGLNAQVPESPRSSRSPAEQTAPRALLSGASRSPPSAGGPRSSVGWWGDPAHPAIPGKARLSRGDGPGPTAQKLYILTLLPGQRRAAS